MLPDAGLRHDDEIFHLVAVRRKEVGDERAEVGILNGPGCAAPEDAPHEGKPPAPEKIDEPDRPDDEPPPRAGKLAEGKENRGKREHRAPARRADGKRAREPVKSRLLHVAEALLHAKAREPPEGKLHEQHEERRDDDERPFDNERGVGERLEKGGDDGEAVPDRHENGKSRSDEGENKICERRFRRVGRGLFVGGKREAVFKSLGDASDRTFRRNDLTRREKAFAKQKEHYGDEKDVLYEGGGEMHQGRERRDERPVKRRMMRNSKRMPCFRVIRKLYLDPDGTFVKPVGAARVLKASCGKTLPGPRPGVYPQRRRSDDSERIGINPRARPTR